MTSKRTAIILSLVIFGAGIILFKTVSTPSTSEAYEAPTILFEASDFTLPLYNSTKTISLKDYRGKTVVLNFWATWCVSCRLEAPGLERTWKKFKDKDVVFIGVNLQETPKEIQKFVDEFGITYPIVIDKESELVFKYGVRIVPTTIFINRDGLVVYVYEGLLNEDQLVSLIEYTKRSTKELA